MDSLESFYREQIPFIERVLDRIARCHRLSTEQRESFGARVHARLTERDFLVLRRFEGQCQITTYVTVIAHRTFREWRGDGVLRRCK